jgi:hypothetical protein
MTESTPIVDIRLVKENRQSPPKTVARTPLASLAEGHVPVYEPCKAPAIAVPIAVPIAEND